MKNIEIIDADAIPSKRSGMPSVSIKIETGVVSLNKFAIEAIGYKSGDRILLCRDKDNPADWFITATKKENGIKFREIKGDGIAFNSKALTEKIADALGLDENATYRIGSEPTVKEKIEWYPILTAKNLKQKRSK